MAQSYNMVVADGSVTSFAVTFPYLDPAHVFAKVDGTPVEFSWISPGAVSITPAPPSQSLVRVYRRTPSDEVMATFQAAMVDTASPYNLVALQMLYRTQEDADDAADAHEAADYAHARSEQENGRLDGRIDADMADLDQYKDATDTRLSQLDAAIAASAGETQRRWRVVTANTTAVALDRIIASSSANRIDVALPAERSAGDTITVYRTGDNDVRILSGDAFFVGGKTSYALPDEMEITLSWRGGLWQIASKTQFLPNWLPAGATEFLGFREGFYWADEVRQGSMASAFTTGGWTFSRPSTAKLYDSAATLVNAGVNVLRFDAHPMSLAPLGVLLERAMTPILSNGEAFDNAYWTKTNSTIQANADAAPDGSLTADRFVPNNTTSSNIQVFRTQGASAATRYSLSVHAKAGATAPSRLIVGMFYSSSIKGGWFNLGSGNAESATGAVSTTRRAGSGFSRHGVSSTPGAVSVNALIAPADSDGNASFAGNGVKYATLWGMQYEIGDFPSSYNGGAARSADSLKRTITPPTRFYRSIGFTTPNGLSTNVIWQMDDGTEANRVRLVRDTSGVVRLIVTLASVETVNISLGATGNESFNRVAVGYDGTAFRAVMNANPTVGSATALLPSVTTERIGSSATAGDEFCGWVSDYSAYASLDDDGLREASRVFPAWLRTDTSNRPADIHWGFIDGHYWANGVSYPTLEAMNTALGATTFPEGDFTIPWTDASVTVVVEALTEKGATTGGTKTYVSIDNAGGGRYQKVYLGNVNAPGARAYWGANQWFREETVRDINNFIQVAATFATSNFSLSVDGATPFTQSSGNDIQIVTNLRVGADSTRGERVDMGRLWRVSVFRDAKSSAEVQALANPNFGAIGIGDSYMGPTGGGGVQSSFSRITKKRMKNLGKGGSTLAEQETAGLAGVAAWPSALLLWWDGKPNGFGTTAADDFARYANVIATLGHTKFIIIPPLAGYYDDPSLVTRSRELTALLLAAWPDNVIDAEPYLKSIAEPEGGFFNRSLLMTDNVHLLPSVHDRFFNDRILPMMLANGWLPEV